MIRIIGHITVAAFSAAILLIALPTQAATYNYDSLSRLVSVTYDDGTAIYFEYDAAGNRTRRIAGPPDADGDSILIPGDNCPSISNYDQADGDNDNVGDLCDNCPSDPNTTQIDGDGDEFGNICDACLDTPSGAMVGPNGCAPGDCDADSDVDLTDFGSFSACFNGPNRPPVYGICTGLVDFDDDGDVDLTDFSVFSQCFNGPNRPPACP
ncbi:MAG: RHS repeat protein [Phycisphaerae bacterium]|nr:RHS repeat protein [Phycisphaerae bacterium]